MPSGVWATQMLPRCWPRQPPPLIRQPRSPSLRMERWTVTGGVAAHTPGAPMIFAIDTEPGWGEGEWRVTVTVHTIAPTREQAEAQVREQINR